MSFINRAGLLAATALASTPRPRAVHAAPRADAGGSPAEILANLQKAFSEFKVENDTKLSAKADGVLAEKVERINADVSKLQAAIDEANTKLAAQQAGAGTQTGTPEDRAYAADFNEYFRRGDKDREVRSAQRTGVRAALSVNSNPDGGYLAPTEWDRTITNKLKIVSPLRDLATVQQISTAGFTKVFNDRAVGSGWVGEVAPRPQTTNPQFASVTYTPGEIYANPAASQQLLDDAVVDIEQWLAGEVEAEFGRQEGIAFVTGDGVNKPKGILTYTAGGSHPWGAVPVVNTGAAGALTADGLIDLVYDLPSEYTENARFAMNRATQAKIRSFKDSTGQYLWAPSLQVGQPSSILGYPVTEMGAMPNIAADAIPVVFGDFRRGYLVVDRMGIRLLRDPYSNKPFVMFYTTKRVGGGVLDPTALRYHKVAA